MAVMPDIKTNLVVTLMASDNKINIFYTQITTSSDVHFALFCIDKDLIDLKENYIVVHFSSLLGMCYFLGTIQLSFGCTEIPEQFSNSSLSFSKMTDELDFPIQNILFLKANLLPSGGLLST